MFQTFRNAWKIPDLRRKILYTIMMIAIFRIGGNIPVPGIDKEKLTALMGSKEGLIGIFDLVSGGSFKRFTIFALGIQPYITASIILNLLQISIPSLEKLAKQGVEGRKKLIQYTRYGTIILAVLQGIGFSYGLFRPVFVDQGFATIGLAVLTITAGTAFLMYLGEHITEKGIGNGISIFIFAGIIARVPSGITGMYQGYLDGKVNIVNVLIFVVVALFIIAGVILVQQGSRKVPVQYAKRVVGRKMYGGQSTHIPLKVNQAGVIPVIFAISILAVPQTIASFIPDTGFAQWVGAWLSRQAPLFLILEFLLIIFFSYFYTSITFNPFEIAENLKKGGGFIPGIRAGKPTVEYLSRSVNKLIVIGSIFLGIIAVLPSILLAYSPIQVAFGGTSLLIVVGVALETSRQIEAQMTMRNHSGFLR